jgi:hypothetical protein
MENVSQTDTIVAEVQEKLVLQQDVQPQDETDVSTSSSGSREDGNEMREKAEKLDSADPYDFTGADGKIRTFWTVTEDGEVVWDEEKAAAARTECDKQRDMWTRTGPDTSARSAAMFKP